MTAIRKSGGSNVALTTLKRRSGSSWVAIQNGYRRAAGAWVRIYTAVAASASPTSVGGSTATSGQAVSTSTTTASLTGATPTGFSWTRISGSTSVSITNPTNATTAFSGAPTKLNPTLTAAFQCTITYAGGSAVTNSVTATINYTGP